MYCSTTFQGGGDVLRLNLITKDIVHLCCVKYSTVDDTNQSFFIKIKLLFGRYKTPLLGSMSIKTSIMRTAVAQPRTKPCFLSDTPI